MCGIFGCIGKIDHDKALQCVQRMQHRGPDALNVRQLGEATLGHARLTILDKDEAANQPMQDASGRYNIVYNGEIYNFIELREELKLKGYRFRTQSDTEVLLYAYIEWDEAFQDKCNGMWSVAIWDSYEKKMFLSRDRFGIKPLYFLWENGNFYFASEMKAFFPVMKERQPNHSIFGAGDYFNFEATDECSIRGINKLTAGTCAIWQNGHFTQKSWWNTLEHLQEISKPYEEQVEMLRELFLDACKIRMRSDVPIGTALSGGIDSSCTLGAMHYLSNEYVERKANDWQHAFVAHMPDTCFDETKYAQMAAEHIGIQVERVNIDPQIGVDELLRYLYLCEEPYITSPVPYIQTYRQINNAGIKVTLDGHGADELFGGYSFDLFSACMDAGSGTKEFDEVVSTYNETCMSDSRVTRAEAFNQMVLQMKNNCTYGIQNDKFKKMGELNRRLYIETHDKFLPTLLRCYDRFSMASGVESRMPFMDYRIVCFAFSIPWTSKIRDGYTKAVVRDMARPFMRKDILNRKQKIGFNAPNTKWFKGELKEFLLDIIHSKDFKECNLINALDVYVDVNEFLQHDIDSYQDGERIWTKIVPYLWKKAVIDCD